MYGLTYRNAKRKVDIKISIQKIYEKRNLKH